MITWLVSYPKSGNTWLRLFLAHYYGWTDPNNTGPFGDHDTAEWAFNRVSAVPGRFDEFESYALKPAALLHMATTLKRFCDRPYLKSHGANMRISAWPQFPAELTAGAVYVVRDPRDVAVSYAHHMGKTVDEAIDDMGNEGNALKSKAGIHQFMGSWSMHVRSWKDRALVVRYEDLPDHFGKVLDYLDLSADPEKYEASVAATSFETLKGHEAKHGFKESVRDVEFFRSGQPGAWKEALSSAQVDKIEFDHGEMMEAVGYD